MQNRTPVPDYPDLLDIVIGNICQGLSDNIGWLDRTFGRAERLVKYDGSGRRYYTPNVYAGGNDYIEVSPDSGIGNFCFFLVEDPQDVTMDGQSVGIDASVSVIFWFDYRRIFNSDSIRNSEAVKREILDVLNGGFRLRKGRMTVKKIYEQAENIYKGFSLDETDNQFLMHPYGGMRIEFDISVEASCIA